MASNFIFTVSEVNQFVSRILSSEDLLQNISVRGEISNWKRYSSGHIYFSIKDENALVRGVWFKQSQFMTNTNVFSDGMKVIVQGSVSLYERDGQYQLQVHSMRPDGVGSLYERFLHIRETLEREGLFDASRKKAIPAFPRRIGIITSPNGAAIHDMIQVSSKISGGLDLVIYPVHVQGSECAPEVIKALLFLSHMEGIDLIVISRGGGSMEDLWGFNDDELARAVYDCEIPVISAVGHETDFTILDYVADARAATPTEAAQLFSYDRSQMQQRLMDIERQLERTMAQLLLDKANHLHLFEEKLKRYRPQERLEMQEKEFTQLDFRLKMVMDQYLSNLQHDLNRYTDKMSMLNVHDILKRGFTILQDKNGRFIKKIDDVKPDDQVKLLLQDGSILAQVQEIVKRG